MIRQVIRGATLRRESYVRAVIGSDGTGDAVILVAAVYLVLALTISSSSLVEIVDHAFFLLRGAFGWLILSGIVYLIARYGFRGEGSYQGVLAVSGLAHPVLLLLVLAQLGSSFPLRLVSHPTLLMLEAWRLDFLPAVITIVATLWFLAILAAGTRVAMSLTLDRAVITVGAAYMDWFVVAVLFRYT